MREPQPTTIHLKDYAPPAFLIERVALDVDLRDADALVKARLEIRRNPASAEARAPLALDGDELQLAALALDGVLLRANRYSLSPERLVIPDVPAAFTLETVSRIVPHNNTRLEGLYASASGFVTQCEAEGFRRITWFIDRPDVMARYTTTVHADKARYPVLLSNGNLSASGEEPGGRHFATFEDPFPKPSYLFALVAAKLEVLEDAFTSRSGKRKQLAVYVEPGKLGQARWAMDC
ncbi:MAG: aminopeptidase N, partial [Betaproteobacteria bacterium]